MFPTVVPVQGEIDLHERTPFRALRFADEIHARLGWCPVGLVCVATDAGTNDVFPGRRAAPVARNDVVEVQILPVKNLAAILAGVFVAFKNIVPGELHFLFRHPVIHEQQDDARHADAEGDAVNGVFVRAGGGNIAPFGKIKSAEGTVGIIQNDLGVALKEQRESAPGGADIDCLPEPVQNQNMLVQCGFHGATVGKLSNRAAQVNHSAGDTLVTPRVAKPNDSLNGVLAADGRGSKL